MTTSIKIHVNGRYKTTVKKINAGGQAEEVVVHGNYEGSPNPSGEHNFYLYHPAEATIELKEEYIPEEPKDAPAAAPATEAQSPE